MTLEVGDRVRRGSLTGTISMGHVPVLPPGADPQLDVEHLCRVRWDGHTFSTVEDARGLTVVDG